MVPVLLLKIGGAELADGPSLDKLVRILASLAARRALLVVHGGGPEISHWQERLGIAVKTIDGLRVTDRDSLLTAEMVLSGLVNKRLVGKLEAAGIRACGISGVDGGLFQARRLHHPGGDLGLVGEIVSVNTHLLDVLLGTGYTPVISPISAGIDELALNVNADHAALALAHAVKPAEAAFLTNVPGVLSNGKLLPALNASEAEAMIRDGAISGGMIPKVRSALEALEAGVGRVLVADLDGLESGTGTWLKNNVQEKK